jgi:hypothetical protein
MAQTPPPTGKIHGHVTDPTGVPKGPGTIGLSTDLGHTFKYTFPSTPPATSPAKASLPEPIP